MDNDSSIGLICPLTKSTFAVRRGRVWDPGVKEAESMGGGKREGDQQQDSQGAENWKK